MYTNKLSVAKSSHYFPPLPLPPPPPPPHATTSVFKFKGEPLTDRLIFLGFEIRPGKYLILKPSKVAGGLMPPTPLLKVKFKGR
jgi:hypothetical protein